MRALFGIRIEVMGGGEAVPSPVIVLVRHASIVDYLLSANLVARPHRIRLRHLLPPRLGGVGALLDGAPTAPKSSSSPITASTV